MYEAIFQPISNRADWFGTIELVDDDSGDIIDDLSDLTAKIEIRTIPSGSSRSFGGLYDCSGSYGRVLSGTTEDGHIDLLLGGVIQWHFTASEMRGLASGTYQIGILVSRDNITEQELIGTLPIIDGIVRS